MRSFAPDTNHCATSRKICRETYSFVTADYEAVAFAWIATPECSNLYDISYFYMTSYFEPRKHLHAVLNESIPRSKAQYTSDNRVSYPKLRGTLITSSIMEVSVMSSHTTTTTQRMRKRKESMHRSGSKFLVHSYWLHAESPSTCFRSTPTLDSRLHPAMIQNAEPLLFQGLSGVDLGDKRLELRSR